MLLNKHELLLCWAERREAERYKTAKVRGWLRSTRPRTTYVTTTWY